MAGAAQSLDLDEAIAWTERQGARLQNASFEVPLKRAALIVKSDIQDHFRKQQAPDGTSWAPLKHQRVRPGSSNQALRDTGLLLASVTSKSADGHIEEVTGDRLVYGTNLIQAAIHHYGGVIRAKKGKFLAIPITKEAYYAGSPRRFPRPLFLLGHSVLAEEQQKKRGKKQQGPLGIVRHYLLVKSVTIPARPFVGLSNEALNDITIMMADWAVKKMGSA